MLRISVLHISLHFRLDKIVLLKISEISISLYTIGGLQPQPSQKYIYRHNYFWKKI